MRWLKIGIVIIPIILVIYFIAVVIIGVCLWNVPLAQKLFTFLEISAEFPNKVIALFTACAAGATLFLAWATVVIIKNNIERYNKEKQEKLLEEILKWSINVGTYMLSRNLPPFEKHFNKDGTYFGVYLDESIEDTVIAEYTKFRMQSVHVTEISKGIPRIRYLVNDAVKHLRGEIRLLNKYKERYNAICQKSGELKAAFNIARNEDRLYDSIVEIIKTIGNIISLD